MLGGVSVIILGAILLMEPQKEKNFYDKKSKDISPPHSSNIHIKINNTKNSSYKISKSKEKTNTKQKKHHRKDFTVKAKTIDHSGRFLLEIIDTSMENKEVEPVNIPGKYYALTGKINGGFYLLKIPKKLVPNEKTKIRIVDLKTRETIEQNAEFLTDVCIESNDLVTRVNIDTKKKPQQLLSVESKQLIPRENPAIPDL